jgi:hypothetical protein
MGLADNMAPHIKAALLEIPQAYRQEVSDALCEKLRFNGWVEDEGVEDTPANRADFLALMFARRIVREIKGIVRAARAKADSTNEDLGV